MRPAAVLGSHEGGEVDESENPEVSCHQGTVMTQYKDRNNMATRGWPWALMHVGDSLKALMPLSTSKQILNP